MNELTLEDLKDSHLKRLLAGEDLSQFQDLMNFDRILLELLSKIVEEFALPKELTPEAQEEWYRENFTQPEQAAIKFIADWQNEILLTVVRTFQAGKLVTSAMPNKRIFGKFFANEKEWHELMLTLYFNEIYRFKCRVENHLNVFEKRLNNLKLEKYLHSKLKNIVSTARNHLVKQLEDRISVRGTDVHLIGYQDKNLDRMELYGHVLRLKLDGEFETWNLKGHIKESRKYFKWDWKKYVNEDKTGILLILNNLSWVFRIIISHMSPKFESIMDWEEFHKRFPTHNPT